MLLSLPFLYSDVTTAVFPSAKADLFSSTFFLNSTLDDSGAILSNRLSSKSFISYFVISSKDLYAFYELNSEEAYDLDDFIALFILELEISPAQRFDFLTSNLCYLSYSLISILIVLEQQLLMVTVLHLNP